MTIWNQRTRAARGVLLGGAVAALLMAGAWEAEARPDADAPAAQEDGKKLYGSTCGACHQTDGSGVMGVFPPLAGSEWVTADEERLVKIILHGLTGDIEVDGEMYSGSMPPFGSALKDAQIAAVATYVRTSWGNKASAVDAATVARIRKATLARKTPWTAKELALAAPKK